jgi:hypothetical protein
MPHNFDRTSREMFRALVEEFLTSGWDFTDPAGKMHKSPDEVKTLLTGLIESRVPRSYSDLTGTFKFLFDHIWDAYGRWVTKQRAERNDLRDLLKDIINENPAASESELQEIFMSTLRSSPDYEAHVSVMINAYIEDHRDLFRKDRLC